ncbi:L-threonylcarbamoyladenylate synthase [Alloscardovia omnicolens]|uniref:L-threonylcarbamoyladenylate synthase n=1 Tax=Alloscardovia omnicolens TaxID=419015 RepID=UPI003A797F18
MAHTYGIQPVNEETLDLAVSLIRSGEIVVIPTDTVYGVVADPTQADAVEKIFQAKHRPHEKSVQILAARLDDTEKFGVVIPPALTPVAQKFMPGAISIIATIDENMRTSKLCTVREEADGFLTQAVRLPDNPASLKILSTTGPLAASSANLSGHISPTTAQESYDQLGDSVSLYIDGGATPGPVASTVVAWDAQTSQPVFLREGAIHSDAIRSVLA